MPEIRTVQMSDQPFWYTLDKHLPILEFAEKVRQKQGYVLSENGKPIGLLRYNLFWDNTPFCTLLYIAKDFQRMGYGRFLMQRWESDMRDLGYDMIMTSTQADEEAQHFYRKLGYRDCGGFVIDILGHEQPMELILVKKI